MENPKGGAINWSMTNIDDSLGTGPNIYFQRGSGATFGDLAVSNGGNIGTIIFSGIYNSGETSSNTGAKIWAEATENWIGNSRGTKLVMTTVSNKSADNKERFFIDGSGHTNIGNGTLFTQSFSPPIDMIQNDQIINDTHHTILLSGATSVTLPLAKDYPNRIFVFKRHGTSNVEVRVDPAGGASERIVKSSASTSTNVIIPTDGLGFTVQSDGVDKWYVINVMDTITPP